MPKKKAGGEKPVDTGKRRGRSGGRKYKSFAYSIPPELAALYESEAKARKVSRSKLVAAAMAEFAAANGFKFREPAAEQPLSPKAEKYLKEHGIEL